MPNWVNNRVYIHSDSKTSISDYLVTKKDKTMMFNIHRIYPDFFPEDDPTGEKNWEYDKTIDLT